MPRPSRAREEAPRGKSATLPPERRRGVVQAGARDVEAEAHGTVTVSAPVAGPDLPGSRTPPVEGAYPDSVRNVEQIVEQIRAASGADFAFVLTRKGRLVTYRAPRDMPELGRNRLVRAARPIVDTDRVLELTLAREELVPYGGAAPVDVYVGVAAAQAIVCVVMATWADKLRVASALGAGLKAIEPLLRRGLPAAGRKAADVGPAKGSPWVGDRRNNPTSMPPPPSGLVPSVPLPRPESLPEIHVGEAELGRLSMAAIRHDVEGSASLPEITFGEGELGRQSMVAVRRELLGTTSAPDIVMMGEAALGRESLAAIDQDGKPRPTSSPDAIRVELVSFVDDIPEAERTPAQRKATERLTVPWVELPSDTKRAADAATLGRRLAPPRVTLKLEEADDGVLDATHAEMGVKPAVPRPAQPTLAFDSGPSASPTKPVGARAPQATLAFDSGAPVLPPLPAKPARR